MFTLNRVLGWFIGTWLALAIVVNALAVIYLLTEAPNVLGGWRGVARLYSPFHPITYFIELLLISPALGAYVWLGQRRNRVPDTQGLISGRDPGGFTFRQWMASRTSIVTLGGLLATAVPSFLVAAFVYGAFVRVEQPGLQYRIFSGIVWAIGWFWLDLVERDSHGSVYPVLITIWVAIWSAVFLTVRYIQYRMDLRRPLED